MLQWLLGPAREGCGEDALAKSEGPAVRDAYSDAAMRPLLRQVERMANFGFWRYEIESRQVFWSPQVFEIYGLPISDHVDIGNALKNYPQPHRAVLEQAIARSISSGEPYDLELDFHCAKGTRKRVRAIGEPEQVNGKTTALIGVMQDISERYRLEEELRAAATTDPLTGLPNRRHLEMFYRDIRLDCERGGRRSFAVAVIDLDHFKAINDRHGHAAGDSALVVTASRLQNGWLKDCFAARLGGDEFVLIVKDPEMMRDLQSTVRNLLADLRKPSSWDGAQINLSATIGVAVSEWGSSSFEEMLECADAALYVAKSKDRGSAAITTREDLFMGDPAAMGRVEATKAA